MKKFSSFLLLIASLCVISCTHDPELESGGFKLSLRSINNFEITQFYNGDKVSNTFYGVIDEAHKTINISLPADIPMNNQSLQSYEFKPSLQISRGASITPKNLEGISLKFNSQGSDSLLYTVISEDGRKAEYTLRWNYSYKYTKADILCYEYPDIIDTVTKMPLRTLKPDILMKYPKSWFTYSTPITLDKYGEEIGSIRMRIIMTSASKNATLIQPTASEVLNGTIKFLQNPTRLSLTAPFDCYRSSNLPVYKFSIKSEDGKTTKSYTFSMDWNTAL